MEIVVTSEAEKSVGGAEAGIVFIDWLPAHFLVRLPVGLLAVDGAILDDVAFTAALEG